ncbi:cytochrome P450 [Aspergillus alliaceus]|uniref:cytochrome P450 n=1 Tax=Petromyces alliaceus TaxID=209559 RepID=UPI0012A3DBC1|nr:cytochrome P450 [Aspergillus alliaceus]KAB8234979.1 cytochrome P450 [Aspergillus alliaceus]
MIEALINQSTPGKASIYFLGVFLLFSMDFIYKSFLANRKHQDPVFWDAAITTAKGSRFIFTKDPENVKAILAGQFADYGKGGSFHRDWKEFLGDSIFVTDGELYLRKKHVQHLIPLLSEGTSPTGSRIVDVGPLFFRYTLDAATDYLLGQGTDSLQNPTTLLARHLATLFNFILSQKEFRRNLKTMDDFIQPYIDRALSLSTAELDQKISKKDTFLDSLARFTRDSQVLRDQLVAILLAGRDTTAGTLSFCIFELSRNPAMVAKLRCEIKSHLGLGTQGRKPTYNDLKDMKYLNAILNETTRLCPVVPFNVCQALRDTTLPRGGGPDGPSPIGIRADTRILYSTMLMRRNPENYDPPGSSNYFDPERFHPECWLSENMGYTVVRILQAFREIRAFPVRGKDAVEDPVLRFEVTLSPGSELN